MISPFAVYLIHKSDYVSYKKSSILKRGAHSKSQQTKTNQNKELEGFLKNNVIYYRYDILK